MGDFELAKRAIGGDHDAFLKVLELNEDVHYRIAYSYLRNEHDALEAIQEFTYRSIKKIHTVKHPEFLSTWLIRILLNVCHDMKRKLNRVELKKEIEMGETQNTIHLELSEAISKLSIDQQQLIYLKYYKDLKNEEIAETIQIPEGTVKSRLHTTLKKLRSLFGEGGK
nr:sigma-70 family RNA polymerase sigma factor [Lysinibacillus timonensis]